MSTIPKQETTMSKSSLLVLLVALLLGWLSLPLVVGATGAVLFFVIVALIILILRLVDRSNALFAVVGLVIGILIGLLVPSLSSSVLGGDNLVRTFFVLYLVMIV